MLNRKQGLIKHLQSLGLYHNLYNPGGTFELWLQQDITHLAIKRKLIWQNNYSKTKG